MKSNVKSFSNRKGLRVLSKVETRNIKGGTGSTSSTASQTNTVGFVIEEIIQV